MGVLIGGTQRGSRPRGLLIQLAGEAGAFEGPDQGLRVEVRARDRGGIGGEIDLDAFDAFNGFKCRLHLGGTPEDSCHAADRERDRGGIAHFQGLSVALAGYEGQAAEPQEDEEELFHGLDEGLGPRGRDR